MPELHRRMHRPGPTTPEPPDLGEGRGWRAYQSLTIVIAAATIEPRRSLHCSPCIGSERGRRGGGSGGRGGGRSGGEGVRTRRRICRRMESPLPYPPLNTAMEKSPLLLPCQTVALPAGLSRAAVLPAAGAVTTGPPPKPVGRERGVWRGGGGGWVWRGGSQVMVFNVFIFLSVTMFSAGGPLQQPPAKINFRQLPLKMSADKIIVIFTSGYLK